MSLKLLEVFKNEKEAKKEIIPTKYKNTSEEELLKLWDNESRNYLRGIGAFIELNGLNAWFLGVDTELITELKNREIHYGRYDDWGVYNPNISKEELARFENETVGILELQGERNRIVVIDTCTSEELKSKLQEYENRKNIYYTPDHKKLEKRIFGPLSLRIVMDKPIGTI